METTLVGRVLTIGADVPIFFIVLSGSDIFKEDALT